jgi:hypothetical protein
MRAENIGLDIDNAMNSSARCLLQEEQLRLADSYAELANVEIDLHSVNLGAVMTKIQECYSCFTNDFTQELPNNIAHPWEIVSTCNGETLVPFDHIKQFVIYEKTDKNSTSANWIEAYNVASSALPYTFIPSTDVGEESGERYWIWWDQNTIALAVKVDADTNPGSSSVPPLSFNVAAVIAQLKDEYVDVYGTTSLRACSAMLMTNNIMWETGYGLDKSVDSNNTTFPQVSGNPPEVVVLFQFKV